MPRIGSHVFKVRDFVKETTQTSGTGAYTLDGVSLPEEGHQSFLTAVGDGEDTLYGVKRGSTWEVVIGTVSAGAPVTLSRDRIMGTSVEDIIDADPINWPTTDTKDIWIGSPSAVLNLIQGPGQVAWDSVAGGNNALTVDVDPIITEYFDGMTVWFRKGDTTNTASMTLNVNSIGAKSFVKSIGTPMEAGDAAAHALMGAVYVAAEDDFVAIAGITHSLVKGLQTPKTLTGTSVDFTVSSLARRITVMFGVGCSSNGTSPWLIRLGDSGGIETTGYSSAVATATGDTTASSAAGFRLQVSVDAAQNYTGEVVLTRFDPSTHAWQCKSTLDGVQHGAGNKTLSAVITTVRVTTTNGTDAFDGGTVGCLVEYE